MVCMNEEIKMNKIKEVVEEYNKQKFVKRLSTFNVFLAVIMVIAMITMLCLVLFVV